MPPDRYGLVRVIMTPYGEASVPQIMCDRCKKLVDRITYANDYNGMSLRFRAYCHGEHDECVIPHWVVCDGHVDFAHGVAFRQAPAIEAEKQA